jgi:phosphate transport system substrate-binding protein
MSAAICNSRAHIVSKTLSLKGARIMKKLAVVLLLAAMAASAAYAAGTVKVAGSTTVLPLSQAWAEAYMAKRPDVSISVSGGGSGVGIASLLNGSCDIANASRGATPKEYDAAKVRNSKLVEIKLAKDGLAIIVNSSNNVKNVTLAQLAAVYFGKTRSWKQLGGNSSRDIVLAGRDSSSGTYGFFQEKVLGGKPYAKDMLSLASNKAVEQAVIQSKDAIGYVGLAYAKEAADAGRVRILSLSVKSGAPGILPTDKTVSDGTYPLFRYLFSYTMGKPKGVAGDFLKWCTGPEGQAMVKDSGYLPL